jgi:hypothetical protein
MNKTHPQQSGLLKYNYTNEHIKTADPQLRFAKEASENSVPNKPSNIDIVKNLLVKILNH